MLFFPEILVGVSLGWWMFWCSAGYCGLLVARCVPPPAFKFIMLDFRASVVKRISQTYNGVNSWFWIFLNLWSLAISSQWPKTGAANR